MERELHMMDVDRTKYLLRAYLRTKYLLRAYLRCRIPKASGWVGASIDRFFLHFAGEESYHRWLSDGEQLYFTPHSTLLFLLLSPSSLPPPMQIDRCFLHFAGEESYHRWLSDGEQLHFPPHSSLLFLLLSPSSLPPQMQIDRFFLHFAGEESYHSRLSDGEQRYCDRQVDLIQAHLVRAVLALEVDLVQAHLDRTALPDQPSLPSSLSTIFPLYHLPSLPSSLSTIFPLYHLPSLPSSLSTIFPLYHLPSLPSSLSTIFPLYHLPSLPSSLSTIFPLYHLLSSLLQAGRSGAGVPGQDRVSRLTLDRHLLPVSSRQVDLVQAHLDRTALTRLPRRYQSILKQADSSETPDMIPTPDLDTFVFCVATRPLPSVQLSKPPLISKPHYPSLSNWMTPSSAVPTPDLDTFVFCVATRPLPSVQLDPE
ncbi:unnamed protein product [Closterium sp. NIES-64]|nr:unnamed protein product [Closterium sp. NIES-64]